MLPPATDWRDFWTRKLEEADPTLLKGRLRGRGRDVKS
jgi:hypothetical protein